MSGLLEYLRVVFKSTLADTDVMLMVLQCNHLETY